MNPLAPMLQPWYQPHEINSFQDFAIEVAWLVLPWILLYWILAVIVHILFPNNRAHYGAQVSIHLAYAWAGFWLGAILLADVIVLLILGNRIPGWASVAPHATLIFIGLVIAFSFWAGLRDQLKQSQVPLRQAQQGAR